VEVKCVTIKSRELHLHMEWKEGGGALKGGGNFYVMPTHLKRLLRY